MAKIKYISKRFNQSSSQLIEQANEIIEDYQAQGFDLTLRQLYYKFIAKDLFPEDRRWEWTGTRWRKNLNGTKNAMPNYTWLSTTISNGRMAGRVDWDAIVDRTRNLEENSHWQTPSQIIKVCERSYQIDKWENQPIRPEIWVEKDALTGIIQPICSSLDVSYFACRGYTSQSSMKEAADRLDWYIRGGQVPVILHFGDHDPSGLDMTRDIKERLEIFFFHEFDIQIRRLALNLDQINKYQPPPSPAKVTDPRAKAYIMEFGDDSWELDALEPSTLTNLIYENVVALRDENLWQESVELERQHKQQLKEIAERI